MTKSSSPLTIEEKLILANRMLPRAEYLSGLQSLMLKQSQTRVSFTEKINSTFRRPAWLITLVILVLIFIGTLAIGPQRVYAEVAKLLGYIPGVGIVDENSSIRVLAKPVSMTRDGITLTVTEATLMNEKTVLSYQIENVPNSALSHDENVFGCGKLGYLVLSDGLILGPLGASGEYYQNEIFSPIALDIQEATFKLGCLQGTLPGKAPENWELPLQFVPAPADMRIEPIISIPTSTLPATGATTQAASASENLYGIKLVLDQALPLGDGYYLIGHSEWTDQHLISVGPAGWAMKAFDSSGKEYPIEPADWGNAGLVPQANKWIYHLYGKAFNGSLTLHIGQVEAGFKQTIQFSLDPRFYGFDGTSSQLGETVKINPVVIHGLGLDAKVVQLKYMKQGDEKGFELGIKANPRLNSLPLNLQSPVSGGQGGSGGGSNYDETSGLIFTYILSDGRMSFPLILNTQGVVLNGKWEISWAPPAAAAGVTPAPMLQACLTLDKWQQALKQPANLPQGFPDQVLIYREALAPAPTLFLVTLDGNTEKELVNGTGSLNSEGSKLVYVEGSGAIQLLDLKTGKSIPLTTGSQDTLPIWSPDGKSIAFVRGMGQQIFVMNADGNSPKAITLPKNSPVFPAWTPDNQIVYWSKTSSGGSQLHHVNPVNGNSQDLFTINTTANNAVVSPDGQWIAYTARVTGRMANGVYLSHLDGSQTRLLVQLDYWPIVDSPSWSPDGKWLAFSALDTDLFIATSTAGLVNVDDCQVIALPQINGTIQSWVGQ